MEYDCPETAVGGAEYALSSGLGGAIVIWARSIGGE